MKPLKSLVNFVKGLPSRASGGVAARFRRKALGFLLELSSRAVTASRVVSQLALTFASLAGANCLAAERPVLVSQQLTSEPAPRAEVNRTVPKVEPPQGGLVLSATPTVQEIFRSHVFADPLVPVGEEPSVAENSALASALVSYAQRGSPDDFSSLTGFMAAYPASSWNASLLTDLGLEYYNTAHYSLALEAWSKAWSLTSGATNGMGKVIGDRAVGELAAMYARIGRMTELDKLMSSVEGREFVGPATERISGAKAGLSNMKNRPEIAFRCGPLALRQIKMALDPAHPCDDVIYKSASTQQGFSLPQVHQLSKEVGLKLQMAFREPGAELVLPAVIHWKVGHYAALIRRAGDRLLVQDPTFRNDVWATEEVLQNEGSGYFLIPEGALPKGWRPVAAAEGDRVWGRGNVNSHDPGPHGPCDPKKPGASCDKQKDCPTPPHGAIGGMAVPSVHLMLVSLNLVDEPVGYSPPVGPAVRFTVTYNQRDAFQPSLFTYANFGSKWTCHWISYITDNPQSQLADVNYYIMGGGTRTFTGFNTNSQTYSFQQYDHTLLTRTGPASYAMLSPDGSKKVFGQSDGATGTSRKIFLTQVIDPAGNAVNLSYDSNFRLAAITDTIGQVTTLSYENGADIYKITKVTDPFGRFATFAYDSLGRLTNITDVIGLTSQFSYQGATDFINTLTTAYGSTLFLSAENGSTRSLETVYPDGDRDRVEFNESTKLGIPDSDPLQSVPTGMATTDQFLVYRNTYYWSKTACSLAYGDYTKAKIYHWLHTADLASASSILESVKEPLEGRVWYDYGGQGGSVMVGTNNLPRHVGRVLDDGTTQLYSYEYDGFGNMTKSVDPVGRTFSYIYDTNGIDRLETRMTRNGANELLEKRTYNSQHLPVTVTDASGQTTTYTYNPRGQILTSTNPRSETFTYSYDTNGYRISIDGPLPGPADVTLSTYDVTGRVRTTTDLSGHTLVYDYDNLDRITRITFPDATSSVYQYRYLDPSTLVDRAGKRTLLEYNSVRQLVKRTDPLGRVTLFQWCKCGDTKSLTDAQGRTTTWHHDVQGRVTDKQFADGSRTAFVYEGAISRLHQIIDEKGQVLQYAYNSDNTLQRINSANSSVLTAPVYFTYDPSYERETSMTDGSGVTTRAYIPVSTPPQLGANRLLRIDRPGMSQQILYGYDELGREVSNSLNGIGTSRTFDAAGRIVIQTNALGTFSYHYDGVSYRRQTEIFPNTQTNDLAYGDNTLDNNLTRITHTVGGIPVSEFTYAWDVPSGRITGWSQQSDVQPPSTYSFGYDGASQLITAFVTNSGVLTHSYNYAYDLSGNRLVERIDAQTNVASYNGLDQLSQSSQANGASLTNEWDAEHRLIAVNSGLLRTEFSYDGRGYLVGLRGLTNGIEYSHRLFLWSDDEIIAEVTPGGVVSKRFFEQGVKIELGSTQGAFYYTRDHLGSVRELLDLSGKVRARYSYDPYGRRTKGGGDVEADLGYAGMLLAADTGFYATRFRMYDPETGRWLSRDPLDSAEVREGPNLYAYVGNNPINHTDVLGLCCEDERKAFFEALLNRTLTCQEALNIASEKCELAKLNNPSTSVAACNLADREATAICAAEDRRVDWAQRRLDACLERPCEKCTK